MDGNPTLDRVLEPIGWRWLCWLAREGRWLRLVGVVSMEEASNRLVLHTHVSLLPCCGYRRYTITAVTLEAANSMNKLL